MQYLYKEGDHYVFMDSKTFDQSHIDEKGLGESRNFLKENMDASDLFWNGRAISVDLPNAVGLKGGTCDPGVGGDIVSGAMKPATLVTRYALSVPLFINEADVRKIDTRTAESLPR